MQKRSHFLQAITNISFFLFAVSFLLGISSCQKQYNIAIKEGNINIAIKAIENDSVFTTLLLDEFDLFQKIDNNKYALLKTVAGSKRITEKEILLYLNALGFTSREQVIQFQQKINSSIQYLNNKYYLNQFSQNQKQSLFEKKYVTLINNNKVLKKMASRENSCESSRIACIASVSAQAAIMHVGCATIDISIIGGIVCHTAALVYQGTESYRCNTAAADCIKQQE